MLSHRDFSHLGCFPQGSPAATASHYPTYGACWVLLCLHNPPNSDIDYRIFNMCTGVSACDCTQGCTDTCKRVCTESWLWEKSPLQHLGIEPVSAACWSDAVPTELHSLSILDLFWFFSWMKYFHYLCLWSSFHYPGAKCFITDDWKAKHIYQDCQSLIMAS